MKLPPPDSRFNNPSVIERELADLKNKTQFVTTGVGVPNFTPTGRALYVRQDGGANTTLYVYEGSAWVPK